MEEFHEFQIKHWSRIIVRPAEHADHIPTKQTAMTNCLQSIFMFKGVWLEVLTKGHLQSNSPSIMNPHITQ